METSVANEVMWAGTVLALASRPGPGCGSLERSDWPSIGVHEGSTKRVAFLESGGGWIAPGLARMDRRFDDLGFNESAPRARPSELFQRNCWISFEPVEGGIAVLAGHAHSDGFFPRAPQLLRERFGPLSPEAKHQVLAGGALGVYGVS